MYSKKDEEFIKQRSRENLSLREETQRTPRSKFPRGVGGTGGGRKRATKGENKK